MASAAEPPGQAAEYLQELTRIVAAQQELLARRRRRIEELERQVARLSRENAGLLERHRRHLAACARRPDPGPSPGPGPQPLGAIPELGGRRDKFEGESSRSVRSSLALPHQASPGASAFTLKCPRHKLLFATLRWGSLSQQLSPVLRSTTVLEGTFPHPCLGSGCARDHSCVIFSPPAIGESHTQLPPTVLSRHL
nr:IQ motif and SEC7 domain-containing protein 3 [Macaca nemestrina]